MPPKGRGKNQLKRAAEVAAAAAAAAVGTVGTGTGTGTVAGETTNRDQVEMKEQMQETNLTMGGPNKRNKYTHSSTTSSTPVLLTEPGATPIPGSGGGGSGSGSGTSSRASSPTPLPQPIGGTTPPNDDELMGSSSGLPVDEDTPMHIKVESFHGSAEDGDIDIPDSDESDSESQMQDVEGGGSSTATTSAPAATSASNSLLSSRAPRSAPTPQASPMGKSPAPSPSPEAQLQSLLPTAQNERETAKEVRDLAHAKEWKDRLMLEPMPLRAALPAQPLDIDKVDQVTDRTSFHTMMDTYFRPIEYLDLFKIGQLKTILPHTSTTSGTTTSTGGSSTSSANSSTTSSSTASTSSSSSDSTTNTSSRSSTSSSSQGSTTTTAASSTSSNSTSTSNTSSSMSTHSSMSSSSTTSNSTNSSSSLTSSSHSSSVQSSNSSSHSTSHSSGSSSSTTSGSTCPCCQPGNNSRYRGNSSNSSNSNYSSSSSYSSNSSSSYHNNSSSNSGGTSYAPSTYSTGSSYSTSSNYSGSGSNYSSSNNYSSSGNYSSTTSTTNFSPTMFGPFGPPTTLPFPYNYVAPFNAGLYNYNTNSNNSTNNYYSTSSSGSGTSSNQYRSSSTSGGARSNSSGSYSSSTSGSYYSGTSSSSSSSSSHHPNCSNSSGGSHSSSSSRSSSNMRYDIPPRVHSSQFVTILQQLRSVSNSVQPPPSSLAPSYTIQPSYWDPSLVLPPLGRKSPNQLALTLPAPQPDSPMTVTPTTPVVSPATNTTQEVGISLPHLPQYTEFPHLSLMLGLTVHPDTVCIPHTAALLQTTVAPPSTTTIAGTASWQPTPPANKPKPAANSSTSTGSKNMSSSTSTPTSSSTSGMTSSTNSSTSSTHVPSSSSSTTTSQQTGSSSHLSSHSSSSTSSQSASSGSSSRDSSNRDSSLLTLAAHPLLTPTKEVSVPVMITMYASSAQGTETARSTQSTDTKQLEADAAMSRYSEQSKEPVSMLLEFNAAGLASSVASLASSISSSMQQQLSKVEPRVQLMQFIPIECQNTEAIGYSIQDRQVEKYRREFKEREATASQEAAEKKEVESKSGSEKSSSAVKSEKGGDKTVPAAASMDVVMKTESESKSNTKSSKSSKSSAADTMPHLETASGGRSTSSVTTVESALYDAVSNLPASVLQQLIEYVMLEAHHQAAARFKENAAAEKQEAKLASETRVKIEGQDEPVAVDMDIDTAQKVALSYASNLPHSLIPASVLLDLPPLPSLPPLLAEDSVLHELLQLQYYLYLQTNLNRQAAAALRGQIMLQHQRLYIEKRIQWMRTIHETYACATLWQNVRLQLRKGVKDAVIPISLLRADHMKQLKEEQHDHERGQQREREDQSQPQWNIKTEISSLLTGTSTKTGSHHSKQMEDSKLFSRSKSAPTVGLSSSTDAPDWTLKTDEQIEAELAQADSNAEGEDYSVCAICFDNETTDDNPLLFCDRCNVSVHRTCFGLKTIPDIEGWVFLCDWCIKWKEKIKQNKIKEKEKEKAKLKLAQVQANLNSTLTSTSTTPTPISGSTSGSTTPLPLTTGGTSSNTSSAMTDVISTKKSSSSSRPPKSLTSSSDSNALSTSSSHHHPTSSSSSSSHPATNPYICVLCPNRGGAVKPASDVFDSDGEPLWVHIVCAIWIPKVRIMNTRNMAPISVAPALKLQQHVLHRQCCICKLSYGACVPCSMDDCGQYFHPLCAWYDGLYMSVETLEIDCRFLIYCIKHTPRSSLDSLQMLSTSSSDPDGTVISASHLSLYDRTLMRARQQRDLRQRGRAHHSEKTREKRRKKQFLDRRRKERARAMREDLYEPGRCAVCFQTETECHQARQYDDVRKKELVATKQNTTGQPYFLVNGVASGTSVKNRLLHCDECEIDVHQNCYGITDAEYDEIQKRIQAERHNLHMNAASSSSHHSSSSMNSYLYDSGWQCRRCQQSTANDKDVSCALCPRKGGAFKKTVTGRWAHVACAIWIPETGFADPIRLEPIEGLTEMNKLRKRMMCYLCQRTGACIQCSEEGCLNTFHVTCGLFSGTYMGLLESQPPAPMINQVNPLSGETTTIIGQQPPPITHYKVYCKKHTPLALSKFVTIPLSYLKLQKLRMAYENCRTSIEKLRVFDKKKLSELKEECEYEELVWRESRLEAETGTKSKKLKPQKQPRGKKALAAAAMAAQGGSSSTGGSGAHSSSTPSGGYLTNSPIQSPMKGGLSSPMRGPIRGRPNKSSSTTGGNNSSGLASGSGGGSSSDMNIQNSPSALNLNNVSSMLGTLPFPGNFTDTTNSGSNSFASNLSSLNNSLNFPFSLPPSTLPLNLPLGLGGSSMPLSLPPLSGSNSSSMNSALDLQPLIDLTSQRGGMGSSNNSGGNKGGRGRKPSSSPSSSSSLSTKDLSDPSQPSLQLWMQALESSNNLASLAAASGLSNSSAVAAAAAAAAYNASNPFGSFTSSMNNSLAAQYNISAFYQQLAAAAASANLPGLLGGTNNSSNALSNSLANAFTNSLTQSLAASLTNSLGGMNYSNPANLMNLLTGGAMAGMGTSSNLSGSSLNSSSLLNSPYSTSSLSSSSYSAPSTNTNLLSSSTTSNFSPQVTTPSTTAANTTSSSNSYVSTTPSILKRKAEEEDVSILDQSTAKKAKLDETETNSTATQSTFTNTASTTTTATTSTPSSSTTSLQGSGSNSITLNGSLQDSFSAAAAASAASSIPVTTSILGSTTSTTTPTTSGSSTTATSLDVDGDESMVGMDGGGSTNRKGVSAVSRRKGGVNGGLVSPPISPTIPTTSIATLSPMNSPVLGGTSMTRRSGDKKGSNSTGGGGGGAENNTSGTKRKSTNDQTIVIDESDTSPSSAPLGSPTARKPKQRKSDMEEVSI